MAIPSFPSVHVTGAVHHYVRVLTGNFAAPASIMYLGTAEITPQMQRRRYRQNVMNDIAGKTLPFQKTFDGEAATISVLLSRFSRDAWSQILTAGATKSLTVTFGEETRWSRGATIYGQLTFELWQIYENFFNPAGTSPSLEIGWYWPQVELLNHDTVKAGTQAEGLLMVFDCTPYWVPQASTNTVNANNNERGWLLYSNDDTDPFLFPADVRVPQ